MQIQIEPHWSWKVSARSRKKKKKKKAPKLQAVNCTKADPPRMLILQGPRGDQRVRISLAWNCSLLLRRRNRKWLAPEGELVLANLSNVNSSASKWKCHRARAKNRVFLAAQASDSRFLSTFSGCCCCCCCWYIKAALQGSFFFSFTISLPQPILLMSALAFQTSASQESAKMLGVNLWSDLGSHSIQSHPPSL